MPVYDYRCIDCGSLYDVYHKATENLHDVICPSCGSTEHKKLMSIPAAAVNSGSRPERRSNACEMGDGCCGGACSM